MSKRARMEELAGLLLEAHERAPAPVSPLAGNLKTTKSKTGAPLRGKVSSHTKVYPKTSDMKTGKTAPEPARTLRRPYGDRGNFEKITITLPAEARVRLLEESLRRKKERSPDWPIAAIVREALEAYLGPKP